MPSADAIATTITAMAATISAFFTRPW
jgi:hypothetical protein